MSKEFVLKSNNPGIEEVKTKIIQELNQRIGARQDCKVVIQHLDFRGINALRAYWVMIGNVVKWDAGNHMWIDRMPLWKIKWFTKGEAEQDIVEKVQKDSFGDNAAFRSYRNGWYWRSKGQYNKTPNYHFLAEERYIKIRNFKRLSLIILNHLYSLLDYDDRKKGFK